MSIDRVIGAALVGVLVWAFSDKKKTVTPELQGSFECFHDAIKLEENDERRHLREKRRIILAILERKLEARSLTFESFAQGSYAMRTGVVPKGGNYDIDVGLIFACTPARFADPVALKCLVRDALNGSNRTVEIRRACVTVTYMKRRQPEYHVDLALYLKHPNGQLLLAKGREFSEPKQREWAPSAPRELTQYVLSKFTGEDQAQFRRCIRYLKRWRDENFGAGAPLSVALTLAAAYWFEPQRTTNGTYVDLEALHKLVRKMQGNFGNDWPPNRLAVRLPGSINADLMAGLNDSQMSVFREKLRSLEIALNKGFGDVSLGDVARTLRSQFGSDFPVPDVTPEPSQKRANLRRRV